MTERRILEDLCRYEIGTYAEVIYRNALFYPEEEAFVYGKERTTFMEFNARVNGVIHALSSMGIKKGEVLGILSWNCLELVDIYGAAMKGGFIASPFNPRLQEEELEYLINYSGAKVLFVGTELIGTVERLRKRLPGVSQYISLEGAVPGMIPHSDFLLNDRETEPNVRVGEEDPFIIFYTSGTTGLPRGALYTQSRKMEETRTKALQVGAEQGDRHIMVLPLFHIGGWSHFWTLFCLGACNVIMPQRTFDPTATLEAIRQERATDIHIVPTQLVALLNMDGMEAYDLRTLKRIWYAASPMPVEILRRGMDLFGPIFMQAFGQSESGPDICFLSKKDHQVLDKPFGEQSVLASCGRPCMNVQVRIVDEENRDVRPGEVGEIITRSKRIMKEYWRKPEETREVLRDGWLHTGDMGHYDERGYIYIVDRKKDLIISGGENIYPREIEEVLYRHQAVLEAAVIGLPDPYWIEKVHAVVVLKKGTAATAEELVNFCKAHLAGYKAPKSVEFVRTLPKNPQGKILKRELRACRQGDTGK